MSARFIRASHLAFLAALAISSFAAAEDAPPEFEFQFGTFGAGDGQFNRPVDVTPGPDGFIYVCDALNHRVQKFTPGGAFVAKFGSFGTGPGQFKVPFQIAFDSQGNSYVADQGNNRIQKFGPDFAYLGEWGSAGTGLGQFNSVWGIAVDANDDVYTSEEWNHRIQKFTSGGAFVTSWGGFGTLNGQFDMPRGIGIGIDGSIYISEAQGNRVQRFTPSGTFLTKWGTTGSPKGQPAPSPPGTFTHAYGLDVDLAGFVFVADWDMHPHAGRVQKFTPDSLFVTEWRGSGSDPGEFWEIYDVDVAPNGDIYTADKLNHRIQVFRFASASTVDEGLRAATWARIKGGYR